MEQPSPIDFYFDPISPYGYLASTQIESLAARYGRRVEWRPVLLSVTVLQVMGLKPVPATPLKGDYSRRDKNRLARLLGVPMCEPRHPDVSPIRALRAFLWLKQRDAAQAAAFARSLCARLWARGENISATEDVLDEAARLGLDVEAMRAGMESPEIKTLLREEVDRAIAAGVFGVPFFIVDGEPFWGVDRLWMLEHWLKYQSWDPKP